MCKRRCKYEIQVDSLKSHIRLSLCGIAAKVGFSKLATRAAIQLGTAATAVHQNDFGNGASILVKVTKFNGDFEKSSVNDRKYVFHFRPKPKPEKHLALGRIPKPKPKVHIYVKMGGILLKFNVSIIRDLTSILTKYQYTYRISILTVSVY